MEVRRYLTTAGRNVFSEWLAELADRSAKARIADRIDRLSQGNPGDCKMLGGGLFELRINWGPGYRVYTRCSVRLAYYCFVAETSASRPPIFSAQSNTLTTTSRGHAYNETQEERHNERIARRVHDSRITRGPKICC